MEQAQPRRILVLDGGMGTTLETLGFDVNTPLWGSELLSSDPDAIRDIHKRYLAAGADIIETATYQLTPGNLCQRLSCSEEQAAQILRVGVDVPHSATLSLARGRVALSFGPFGSTLSPGQEYGGLYPPPYGPSTSTNAFPAISGPSSPAEIEDMKGTEEESAIKALAQFHLDKLRVFALHAESWEKVEWIAFETIPVLHEVRGIRRAMTILNQELDGKYGKGDHKSDVGDTWWIKKFWIVSPFPSGQHPQSQYVVEDSSTDRPHVTVEQVLSAMVEGDDAVPNGTGINCTNPSYLPSLTKSFTSTYQSILSSQPSRSLGSNLQFVLYPDGGQVYDTISRTWSTPSASGGPETWAREVFDVAKDLEKAVTKAGEPLWDGVIVGGCCKSSFEEIRALRKLVDGAS
ncbi:hypothetical protein IAR55_005410 [Kwoniella newhampshirensis]|uniref:Hcy-binding domain-containing protein n=1 Tax=Kwoniella newhampshirensis TaxID=1651941 RepID=A0AAW0YIF7_9TREE